MIPREAEVWLLRRANHTCKEITAQLYISLTAPLNQIGRNNYISISSDQGTSRAKAVSLDSALVELAVNVCRCALTNRASHALSPILFDAEDGDFIKITHW